MREDHTNLVDENGDYEITKENRNLEAKYEELLKEIEEKSALMDTQLVEKEEGTSKLEE